MSVRGPHAAVFPAPVGGFLPHTAPALCPGLVLHAHKGQGLVELQVPKDCALLADGAVSLAAYVEIAAQAAGAVHAASLEASGKAEQEGYLAAVRDFRVSRAVLPGETLRIVVRRTGEFAGAVLFETAINRLVQRERPGEASEPVETVGPVGPVGPVETVETVGPGEIEEQLACGTLQLYLPGSAKG